MARVCYYWPSWNRRVSSAWDRSGSGLARAGRCGSLTVSMVKYYRTSDSVKPRPESPSAEPTRSSPWRGPIARRTVWARFFFFLPTLPPDTRANPNRITDRQQSTEINRQEGMSRRKQARPSRAHLEEDLVQGPLLINPVGNVNVTRKCKHHRREIRREVMRKEKRNGKKSREKKGKRNYECVRALSLYRARFQCSCELG